MPTPVVIIPIINLPTIGLFRIKGLGYWGYMGIMEKKMETTIMGIIFYSIGYNTFISPPNPAS